MCITIEEMGSKDINALPTKTILAHLAKDGVFIAKQYWSKTQVLDFREYIRSFAERVEPKWYPIDDDSPSFHRINDEYPGSYVKTRSHQFNFHLWQEDASSVFNRFRGLFELRAKWSNLSNLDFVTKKPSDGFGTRITVNHYPRGGGYLADHTDPVNPYNLFQTLIKGSERGEDYKTGVLQIRATGKEQSAPVNVSWEIGDLIVFDPSRIIHGVTQIDPEMELNWELDQGRYTFAAVSGHSVKNPERIVSQQKN